MDDVTDRGRQNIDGGCRWAGRPCLVVWGRLGGGFVTEQTKCSKEGLQIESAE